jgi:hypothetical protein
VAIHQHSIKLIHYHHFAIARLRTFRRSDKHGTAAGPVFYTVNDSVRNALLNKERANSTSASFLLTEYYVGIQMETKNNPIQELLYLSLAVSLFDGISNIQTSLYSPERLYYRKLILFSLFPELQTQGLRMT